MQTPLLVFDLDGTLVDSAADLTVTLNVILAREGVPAVPAPQARAMVGLGARVLIRRGFAAASRDVEDARLERLFHDYIAYYTDHIADYTKPFPGVVNTLERFADAGYRLAVCTNKIESGAKKLLAELGMLGRFAFVCGQDTFLEGEKFIQKPDPRTLWRTIEAAGGSRAATVMIGDSGTDIETAQAAGVPVVAVDFGYTDRPVESFGPDRVVSHFEDVYCAVADLLPPP
eukprot:gene27130-29912_t